VKNDLGYYCSDLCEHCGDVVKNHKTAFWIDFKYLWLEQMAEVPGTWYFYALFSIFMPLAMVFGFAHMGRGLTDKESLLYVISGSMVFVLTAEGWLTMAIRTTTMRSSGVMTYYSSLPISKTSFILALLFSRLVVIVPSMLVPLVVCPLLYPVRFSIGPWLLVILPLSALSLSAVGIAIGSLIDSVDIVQLLMNVLMFVVLMAAPVFIPNQSLPAPLRALGTLLPPTYAASALRHILNGTIGYGFYMDTAVLVAMTVVSLILLEKYLQW